MNTFHFTKKLAAVVMVTLIIAGNTFAGNSAMKPLVSYTGGFSISMPGSPTYSEDRGVRVWQLMTSSGHLYMVSFSYTEPNGNDVAGASRGFATGSKGQITKVNDFQIDGHPGRYTVIDSPAGQFHHYATISNGRLYQVVFGTTGANPIPSEASEFVRSFKLL